MANKKKNDSEVLELEAIEEIPLEKVIDNTLVKHNVTNAVINGLKEKYGELRLKSIDDKESYLECCDARKDVRKYGILAEKICKAGREDAIKIQKLWLSKQSEVLGKIAEVQDPLDAEINKYEKEVERKELEEANRREEAYMKRQQQLLRMGATYDNGSFVLNHISYESVLIKDSDESIWVDTILPKYTREYEKNEQERVALEKKREEEALAFKQQQAEMDRQRKEFEEQQRVFREQQEQLRIQQEAASKIQRKEDERKVVAERFRINALQTERLNKLLPVNPYGSDVDMATLWTLSDDEFGAILNKKTTEFVKLKKENEERERQKIEDSIRIAKEESARKEREKIAEEQRQLEQKRLREEEEARIKMEQASDKMKWDHFLVSVKEIKYPDMKNATYKGKIEEARKLLIKIINL